MHVDEEIPKIEFKKTKYLIGILIDHMINRRRKQEADEANEEINNQDKTRVTIR